MPPAAANREYRPYEPTLTMRRKVDGSARAIAAELRKLGGQARADQVTEIVDSDGDMIIGEFPYTGINYGVRLLDGTGKWKGIKGALQSERTHVNKPGRAAMPGTFQACRREKGSFELSK
jgi:hypothetical protein